MGNFVSKITGKDKARKQATKMNAENAARQAEADRIALESEQKYRGYEYTANREKAIREAEIAAAGEVNTYRANAIKSSSSLLTDFEMQERRRLQKAKQGVGQVGEGDVAITGKARDEAISLLNKGSDYWEAMTADKRSQAGKKAMTAFDSATGTMGEYIKQGSLYQKSLLDAQNYRPRRIMGAK